MGGRSPDCSGSRAIQTDLPWAKCAESQPKSPGLGCCLSPGQCAVPRCSPACLASVHGVRTTFLGVRAAPAVSPLFLGPLAELGLLYCKPAPSPTFPAAGLCPGTAKQEGDGGWKRVLEKGLVLGRTAPAPRERRLGKIVLPRVALLPKKISLALLGCSQF